MPDLKNKYSDPELNPEQRHYDDEFNRITGTPDNKAFADQGDAIARDLKSSEDSPKAPESFFEGDGKDAARRAESKEWGTVDNGLYQPSEKKQTKTNRWSNKRKLAVAGGGVGGAAGIIALLFMLLPLKVPGIMSMVTDHTMQRVEQVTEKRAKVILGRAILTKFGTHTGIVITGEGAFKTLMASMRTSRFEEKLAAKGLVITATANGVRLTHNGRPLGGDELRNEQAVLRALDSNKLTSKMVNDIVKEEIPTWRWMKRAKFAKWLRIKYGIPRYGLPNSDKEDPEERKKEVDAERAERATSRLTTNFQQLLGCIMNGSCEAIDGSNEASKKATEATSTTNDVETVASESLEAVKQNGLGTSEDVAKSVSKLLIEKLGTKAIPIIGWIDLVATLDHFAHAAGDNDYIGKVSAYYKGASYAAVYADWAGYGSQIQEGAMDPEYVGVLADELNGAETAQAFQAIAGGDTSKGVPIETMVNSDKPSNSKQLYDTILNSPAGFHNKYIGHPILNAYYETVGGGGLLGWVGGLLGNLIGGALGNAIGTLTPEVVKSKLEDTVATLGPYILKTFGLTIDALETGAGLINNIIGGGTVAANEYGKGIGFRKLSNEQAYLQNTMIAKERSSEFKEEGLMYTLFDTEDSRSVINQLAISLPTSVDGTITSVANILTSTPSRLLGLITPNSGAADTKTVEQLYGITPYGATADDLNQPLAREVETGEPCPDVAEDAYNNCMVDTEVIEAMICEAEPESVGCSDEDPSESASGLTGEGTSFTIATYNILHGDDHYPELCRSGENKQQCMTRRAQIQARIIKGEATANELNGRKKNPAFDIVAMQEVDQFHLRELKRILGYDGFPEPSERMTNCRDGSLATIWDPTKFKMIDLGRAPAMSNVPSICSQETISAPWVGLESISTGQRIYVMSIHWPNHVYFDKKLGDKGTLRAAVELARTWVQSKAGAGVPVYILGDFNDHYENANERVTYCGLTRGGLMQHAYDMMQGLDPNKPCPSRPSVPSIRDIDHIFSTPIAGMTVSSWGRLGSRGSNDDSIVVRASDHVPVYATYSLPGATTAGWAWPVAASAWKSDGQRWLEKHGTGSDAWTNSIKAGADINIGSGNDDCGTPVYSMLPGTIVSNPPANTMQVSSQVNGQAVLITYAHGINMKKTGTVRAGEQIMLMGDTGNSTACHLHLEIKYGNKPICPQQIFPLLAAKQPIDLAKLPEATYVCG